MGDRRPKGTGSIFQRGRVWFIQYYWRGERRRESSHSYDRERAEQLLHKRLGEIATGRYLGIVADQATIGDLIDLVIEDYKFRKLRSVSVVEWRANAHLEHLRKLPAMRFNASEVKRYVAGRRAEGAGDATINRELAIIRRGFTLGKQGDPPLVASVPYIPKLEEDNVRQGFLEPEQYERLLEELPPRLKALFVCAYHVGTRKGELRKLQWSQVDFESALINLTARQTKGKTARLLPVYGAMERWLRKQLEGRPPECPWVFYHHGKPVGAQLRGWREACDRAELPGLLFHDLRRSAVRNMKRAGVQDKVAMQISGHKTRAVFDRYNIIDEGDLGDAAKKLNEYLELRKKQQAAKLRRVK
jgi:integrase